MKQKHYMNIERLKEKYVNGFQPGDHIQISEKVDGVNFSIRYDSENDEIVAFSRKKQLDMANNLRGAWEWSQTLDKNLVKAILGSNLVLFSEWLVKHSVVYPDEAYKKAYCYDVYDVEKENYLPQDEVKNIVNKLGLIYIPVFYDGEFISWEHCRSFVGKTALGGEYGEGIVIKNMTRLNDPNTRMPFYTKIVGEKFTEKIATKTHKIDEEKLAENARVQSLVDSVVTEARVRKLVHKLVDEGIIPEDWDEHNMKDIARHIGKNVYYDCVKEEPEIVEQVGETFGKTASSTAMRIVKGLLNDK